MKKFTFIVLLCCTIGLLLVGMQSEKKVSASTPEITENIFYLDNYPDSHYFQIGQIGAFAQVDSTVYYTNETNQLLSYNLSTLETESFNITNITLMRAFENGIYYISEDKLYSFNGTTSTYIADATMFDYYEDDSTNTLAYLYNDTLTIKIKEETYIFTPSEIMKSNVISITATDQGSILNSSTTQEGIDLFYCNAIANSKSSSTIQTLPNSIQLKYTKIDQLSLLAISYESNVAIYSISSNFGFESPILKFDAQDDIVTPNYIDFKNNTLTIADKSRNNIRTIDITFEDDTLTDSGIECLLGTYGNGIDQYNNVDQIIVKTADDILINDKGNSRIKKIVQNKTTKQDIIPYIDQEIIENILIDQENNTITLSHHTNGAYYIRTYNQRNFSQIVSIYQTTEHIITSITTNIDNSILFASQNGIYQINNGNGEASLKIAQNFTNAILYKTLTPNVIYLIDENVLYTANLTTNTLTKITDLPSCTYVNFDYDNHMYMLTNQTLSKYAILTDNINLVDSVNLSNEYAHFGLDQETGTFYFYDTNDACLVKSNTSLYSGMTNYNDYSLESLKNFSTPLTFANTTLTTLSSYPYPYNIGKMQTINTTANDTDKKSFAIIEELNGYSHVAYFDDNNNLKEGYVLSHQLNKKTTSTSDESYYVISKKANLYYLPTQYATTEDTLNKNDTFTALSSFVPDMNVEDFTYIPFLKDNHVVYILSTDILSNTIQYPTKHHTQNATLLTKDGQTITVYVEPTNTSQVVTQLANNTRIYVEKYNDDAVWTKIIYLNENNEEVEGYVLTSSIQTDNPSTLVIICVILSIAGIAILLFVVINVIKLKKKNFIEQ